MNDVHVKKLLLIQLIISDDVKVNKGQKKNSILFDSLNLDLGVCTEFELEVFPKRMTTWLGEILDALVCRKEILLSE